MNRAIVSGALALVSAAACLVLAPAASAAPQACVTSTLNTGYEAQGTITAVKSSTSSCSDLNLTYTDDKSADNYDYYAGRLRRSSDGSWFTCSRGYRTDVKVYDGNHSVSDPFFFLCTDVADGTRFGVASWLDSGDTVKITH
ncbi:hypothetical protein OG937_11205 [Streptomyces sp. NBC_00510]|uniref:hypothetical protein n=1 Tax=Streptomycetaceae TaxID=2062 RepID=UPI00037A3D2D|nr:MULTISPECIES: hypothetical protein [unclassified Streptomyces]MYX38051.1 hypothetical protein [Streptomyces sp. SID8377]